MCRVLWGCRFGEATVGLVTRVSPCPPRPKCKGQLWVQGAALVPQLLVAGSSADRCVPAVGQVGEEERVEAGSLAPSPLLLRCGRPSQAPPVS